jgi:hypothetical protein
MRINLFLSCLILLVFACKKETEQITIVTEQNPMMQPVIMGFSNSMDSLSGSKLNPVFDSIRKEYPNCLIFNIHVPNKTNNTDSLATEDAELFAQFYQVYAHKDSTNHIPYLYFGARRYLGGLEKNSILFKSIQSSIEWAKQDYYPLIDITGITTEIINDEIKVNVKIKTLENVYAISAISVVLTEDNVKATQFNDKTSHPTLQHNVFRKCLTDINGKKIQNSIAKDVETILTYTCPLDKSWNVNNLYANAIIWIDTPPYGKMIDYGRRQKVN